MTFFIITVLIAIGLLLADFLWAIKTDKYMEKEAKRCLQNDCEIHDTWNSSGHVYKKGLALIEQDNQLHFVKQAKLHGIDDLMK